GEILLEDQILLPGASRIVGLEQLVALLDVSDSLRQVLILSRHALEHERRRVRAPLVTLGRPELFEVALRPARLERPRLVVPNVAPQMDNLQEQSDRQDRDRRQAPNTGGRPGTHPSRKTGRRIGTKAE